MNLAVLILHFGDVKKTLSCLSSIKKADINGLKVNIFLIDNGTGAKFPQKDSLKIIRNPKNLGFAAGINRGFQAALKNKKINYLLVLNNDTILPKNFFQNLKTTEFDVTGIIIKFRSVSGIWIYDFGGVVNRWTGRTKHIEKTVPDFKGTACQADYYSGCCLLIKREVLEKIGPFDERFFFYYEDVDFCLRAAKAGFKLGLASKAIIYHELSSSIGRWSRRAIYRNLKSHLTFINKHLGLRRPVGWAFLLVLTLKIIRDKIRKL